MDHNDLHPALARLAASYDAIVEQFSQGLLTSSQARERTLELTARDDNGVIWRLDPDTALWQYFTINNDWKTGIPPISGIVLPTGHDVSGNLRTFNPDSRIEFTHVSPEGLSNPEEKNKYRNSEPKRLFNNYKLALISIVIVIVSYLIFKAFDPTISDVIAPGEIPIETR
jgi:hypothetical protein